MKIFKIDDLIGVCRANTGVRGVIGEEIEEILVHALLINMCAEFERTLKELLDDRCSTVDDPAVYAYATSYSNAAFASPSPQNIGDAIRRFGDGCGEKFARLRSEDSEAWEAYRSIVTNRNHVAHGRPVQVTMNDVTGYYENGHVVLDWFREALWANGRFRENS